MRRKIIREKFAGSMLGTAVGDALGAPIEGWGGSVEGKMVSGRYTDDTHMMIGVAESLIEKKKFDGKHMALTFMQNFYQEPWRGYGPGPPRVFRLIKKGEKWNRASENLYSGGSYGNGGAMRVAPIGLFFYDDPEMLYQVACNCARITHAHPLGMEGAALQALAVALATGYNGEAKPQGFLRELSEFIHSEVYRDKVDKIYRLLSKKGDKGTVVKELGNGIEAFNSVPSAIYSFLSNIDSFKEAVIYAVSLGGDTDTIGAMTGAIAGAYHGVKSIPGEWKDVLENKAKGRDYILDLACRLWKVKINLVDSS